MAKRPLKFRATVYVQPELSRHNDAHHFADNPGAAWFWVSDKGTQSGFTRREDAKNDAVRIHGSIDWSRRRGTGNTLVGHYGPSFTGEEWLNRKCQTDLVTKT